MKADQRNATLKRRMDFRAMLRQRPPAVVSGEVGYSLLGAMLIVAIPVLYALLRFLHNTQ